MRVIACFAASLDGKIADAYDPKARFGSAQDLEHLRRVRDEADASLCGGETFRQYAGVRRAQSGRVPLQCLLTRDINLPPEAPLFHCGVPVVVFTPELPDAGVRARYPALVEWEATGSGNPVPVMREALARRGIQTLLVEGGGQVLDLFLRERALNELYLTVCPLLLGGDAPSLLAGAGFPVSDAPRVETLSLKQLQNEIYLHLRLNYPG